MLCMVDGLSGQHLDLLLYLAGMDSRLADMLGDMLLNLFNSRHRNFSVDDGLHLCNND